MKNWLQKNQKLLFWGLLLLTLTCGISLRHIGIHWGDLDFPHRAITFHPDEPKFMLIAQEFLKEDFSFNVRYSRPLDYLKTTGVKIAATARIIHALFDTFSVKNLYLIGRYISLVYGILILFIVYGIAWRLFKNRWKALLALFFLTFSALHAEHSHYATGDVSSLFWTYLSVFVCLLFTDKQKPWHIPLIAFAAGMTLAIKFSFIPFICLIYILFRSKHFFTNFFTAAFIAIGAFYLSNGFYYTTDDFKIFFNMAFSDNISMRDHNKWLNPCVYLFQISCGVGLTTFLFFIGTLIRKSTLLKGVKQINWDTVFILYFPFSIYFLAISMLDVPFSRHLLPLIPVICIAAADGAGRFGCYLWRQDKLKTLMVVFFIIFTYQFIYNYSIQRYFDRDPRYKAQRWMDNNVEMGTAIAASKYAHLSYGHHVLPNLDNHLHQAEYIVLHESYYYRYMRSELNPLKAPENINEVYRGSQKNMDSIDRLFREEMPFELVKSYKIKTFTPELWLYKKVLGTYPLFLGDMLIYKRLPEGENRNEKADPS